MLDFFKNTYIHTLAITINKFLPKPQQNLADRMLQFVQSIGNELLAKLSQADFDAFVVGLVRIKYICLTYVLCVSMCVCVRCVTH